MAVDYTTTALLASVKRRGQFPSTDETLSTADFLAIATEEMRTYVTRKLLSVRGEFGVVDYDATVEGTADYALPARAGFEALRMVSLSDSSGVFYPLTYIEPEQVCGYSATGQAAGWYFRDDHVVLVPSPTTSGTLRLSYYRRPNALVATTAVATVSTINVARTVITTTATIPSTIIAGISVDVVSHAPGFRTLVMDGTTSASGAGTSGTTITLTAALPSTVVAGNYVCLAGEAPVPQIPVEAVPLLIERTRFSCLDALGDPKAAASEARAEKMAADLVAVLSPRSKGNPRRLLNPNGPGFGFGFAGRRRWF